MSSTAVATVAPEAKPFALKSPIAKLLYEEATRAVIMPLLRPGEDYDRVIVEVFHAGRKNPEILKCTPESIVGAIARAVSTGLIIGETVHLVPFGAKLEMVLDYKGFIQLVQTSGAARYVDAQCVYANERFEIHQGTSPSVDHVQMANGAKRGALIGAYAIAKVTRDDFRIVYMTVEEIDAIRLAKSKAWKQGPLSAIPWYPKKTAIKQLCKTLPKNPELARVIAMFEREDDAQDELDVAASRALNPANEVRSLSRGSQSLEEEVSGTASEAGNESSGGDVGAEGEEKNQRGNPASSSDSTAPTRNGPAAYPLPFAQGDAQKGVPLGDVSTKDLSDAMRFAQGVAKHEVFCEMATEELERRRIAAEDEAEG